MMVTVVRTVFDDLSMHGYNPAINQWNNQMWYSLNNLCTAMTQLYFSIEIFSQGTWAKLNDYQDLQL